MSRNENLDFTNISSNLQKNTFFNNWILNGLAWVGVGIALFEFAWWHSKHCI